MFDTFAFCLARIEDGPLHEARTEIVNSIVELMRTERFKNALTYSTNSTVQVRTRYEMLTGALHPWMTA